MSNIKLPLIKIPKDYPQSKGHLGVDKLSSDTTAMEKKDEYKTTEAQRRAFKKYSEKNSQIGIRISPEMKERWDTYARKLNMSLRSLIIKSVEERIKK